ncbi:MAG: septum formation initiator family protein [Actinomycetota bacterium]
MSARATATSPAAAPGETTTATPPKAGHRLTPRASILAFVVFVAAIFAVAPARAFLEQRSEQQQLSQQVAQLQQENDALTQRLNDLNDPVHLERLARECLGMVKPGEIAFVPIQRGQAPTPPSCD